MRIFPSLVLALSFAAQSPALPLTFEQRDAQRFLARLPDGAIEVRPDRLTLGDVTLRFSGASANARVVGVGAPAPSTYLRAGFSRTFRQFPKIAIRKLYPGIDAVFCGNGEDLEYDLNIAPGVSPNRIRLSVDGARRMTIDKAGNLIIETTSGTLHQIRPRVLQANREIPARYVLSKTNQIGIRLAKYNRHLPLTIDPVLAYVKYFGSSNSSRASAIAVDSQGNIYVAGQSNSPDFPATPNGFEPRLAPPLIVLSNSGQTVSSISVDGAIRVQLVGGTADGTILYAATADGIFLSGDSGATWRPPTRPPSSGDPRFPQPLVVNSISVDPLDPATLLIATNDGLFGSNSGGEQWGARNTGLPVTGGNRVSVSSVFYHPANPLIAYAVTANPSSIAASKDAGSTWRVLNPTYPGEPAPSPIFARMAAALSTDGAILYAINGNGALLKSADGGSSWVKLTQGFVGPIAITPDPSNPATLYVLDQISLQKSTDGGLTFTKIAAPPLTRSLTVDSAGVIYVADFHQVFVSTDGGATFTSTPVAGAYEITSVSSLGGNVYAGSTTLATPFVTKLDPTGSNILYSTFLGGSNGDFPTSLAVDAAGNAVLGGSAVSPDFPLTVPPSSPPSFSKPAAFVAKLSSDGTHLVYSTVLGSSRSSTVQAVAMDASGAAFVTGQTTSPGFPITPDAVQPGIPPAPCVRTGDSPFVIINTGQHAFVTRISPDGGSLLYSTYLTGSCGSSGQGITVDPAGNAIVVGYTTSLDFPVSPGSYQTAFPGAPDKPSPPNTLNAGFVTRLSPAGDQILASSYLGGGYSTTARAVTLDASGNAYITGFTQGMLRGATPGAYQTTLVDRCAPTFNIGPSPPYTGTGDAFVLKLDPALASARFLTYLGGTCGDFGSSIALDPAGNVWLGGSTGSPDFPVKDPFQMGGIPTSSFAGFVSELSPDASQLLFSSFSESAALAMSPSGVYLAGASGNSALVARVDPLATPPVHIDTVRPMIAFPSPSVSPSLFTTAPGLLIQITGRNLGPAAKVNAQLDSTGRLPFILGNTSVFFDRVPAALVSLEATSIVCVVPFEVGPVSQITVVSGGQRSNAVRTAVAPSAPQILSIANEDGVANSPDHPARVGSVIALFVSGIGQTSPPGADGLVNASPLPVPLMAVNVYLSQRRVDTQSVQAAPGLIAGITQVNVQITPSAVPNPSAQGIALSVNSANATLYVTP